MKTIINTLVRATLAISALSLCSCNQLMEDLYNMPDSSGFSTIHYPNSQGNHLSRHVQQPAPHYAQAQRPSYVQQAGTAYTVGRSAYNPVWGAQQALGNALSGLLPWYGVGSSPSYQHQATRAYGHMSGHGHVGGMTLRDAMQD